MGNYQIFCKMRTGGYFHAEVKPNIINLFDESGKVALPIGYSSNLSERRVASHLRRFTDVDILDVFNYANDCGAKGSVFTGELEMPNELQQALLEKFGDSLKIVKKEDQHKLSQKDTIPEYIREEL
jgi:hypothetical protein